MAAGEGGADSLPPPSPSLPGLLPGPERALEEAVVSGSLCLAGRRLRHFPGGAARRWDLSDTTQAGEVLGHAPSRPHAAAPPPPKPPYTLLWPRPQRVSSDCRLRPLADALRFGHAPYRAPPPRRSSGALLRLPAASPPPGDRGWTTVPILRAARDDGSCSSATGSPGEEAAPLFPPLGLKQAAPVLGSASPDAHAEAARIWELGPPGPYGKGRRLEGPRPPPATPGGRELLPGGAGGQEGEKAGEGTCPPRLVPWREATFALPSPDLLASAGL